ncbi:MAG: hypothetical protein JKY88_18380 [Pseudomonadales bacterium]|nr:hypothetical protein [Pseudomonadales bacterium]
MKKIFFAIVIIGAFMMMDSQPRTEPVKEDTTPPTIFVLIENGGTVAEEDQEEALNTAYSLMQQLISLSRRKATRDTQINIVLSATPNRISWSGTPTKLRDDAELVKELIAFRPTFSDLVMAFDQIETTINLNDPKDLSLYWIGPVIHVPFQTTSNDIQIKVPQDIPAELALINFSEQLKTLKIYRVHEEQDGTLLTYMRAIGVIERSDRHELDFTLLGAAQTRGSLNNLL